MGAHRQGCLCRQQGGLPGRRGHRRAQSSRAGSMRSGGSGSSNSGRHSPARQRSAEPATLPPPLTLQVHALALLTSVHRWMPVQHSEQLSTAAWQRCKVASPV